MGREFVVPAEAFAGAGAESEGKAYLGDRAALEAQVAEACKLALGIRPDLDL
jgi:hypothetical protein